MILGKKAYQVPDPFRDLLIFTPHHSLSLCGFLPEAEVLDAPSPMPQFMR